MVNISSFLCNLESNSNCMSLNFESIWFRIVFSMSTRSFLILSSRLTLSASYLWTCLDHLDLTYSTTLLMVLIFDSMVSLFSTISFIDLTMHSGIFFHSSGLILCKLFINFKPYDEIEALFSTSKFSFSPIVTLICPLP